MLINGLTLQLLYIWFCQLSTWSHWRYRILVPLLIIHHILRMRGSRGLALNFIVHLAHWSKLLVNILLIILQASQIVLLFVFVQW